MKKLTSDILIATTTFAEFDETPLRLLKKRGVNCILNPYKRKLKAEEVIEIGRHAAGLISGTEQIDCRVIESLRDLRVISRCGAGLDNIDLKAAKKRGIKVYNVGDILTIAVAELTIGLVLALLRKITLVDRDMKNGIWEKRMGSLLSGKKVGIIGFGRIGQKVAQFLSAFALELAYFDIQSKPCSTRCRRMTLEGILAWADILTLHLSSDEQEQPIIGEKEISLMKKASFLVNLSRGGLVDEQALYEALKSGHLQGAALDVFKQEPYSGPLKELDNVILTPHFGSYAKESRIKMELRAVENLLRGLKLKL